jgi:penicillin-binding protein activator
MRGPTLMSLFTLLMAIVVILSGCGPKAFTKGEYDDPNRVELLDDKYNESDMQRMAETMIQSLVASTSVVNATKPPILMLERVANRTQEHIDMVSLTDKIRTALIKSHKVKFVNKEERGTLSDEYDYSESGNVSRESAKKRGKQIGVDFILSGNLSTNIQEVGNDKFVYYKLTLNLTHIESSTIDWTEESQIRKKYRKRSIGL